MTPAVAIDRVAAELTRLADFYAKYKPKCTTIALTAQQFQLLASHPDEASSRGFFAAGAGISWRGFSLRQHSLAPLVEVTRELDLKGLAPTAAGGAS